MHSSLSSYLWLVAVPWRDKAALEVCRAECGVWSPDQPCPRPLQAYQDGEPDSRPAASDSQVNKVPGGSVCASVREATLWSTAKTKREGKERTKGRKKAPGQREQGSVSVHLSQESAQHPRGASGRPPTLDAVLTTSAAGFAFPAAAQSTRLPPRTPLLVEPVQSVGSLPTGGQASVSGPGLCRPGPRSRPGFPCEVPGSVWNNETRALCRRNVMFGLHHKTAYLWANFTSPCREIC